MKSAVVIAKAGDHESAYVPDLPGCTAAGGTVEETRQLIQEAIAFPIEGMQLNGETVPPPVTRCEYAEVDIRTNLAKAFLIPACREVLLP